MAATTTISVPHLGGITAGYRLSAPIDATKPTVVLINSMCTTSSLYEAQFNEAALTSAVNLLAIEPLGHGATTSVSEHFTYWDSAAMALQVMDKLGVDKAFALGTSQGGWVVVRMALLAPERILGLLPLGTSMDSESTASRALGAWDPKTILAPFYDAWCGATPTSDSFLIDDVWCGMVATLGFAGTAPPETIRFWNDTLKKVYVGNEGRRKVRMALACLLERDGLLLRLRDVRCPVWWLQGTEDTPYGLKVPAEHIKLFTQSKDAKLEIVQGGGHYLNATSPVEVNKRLLEMVEKYKL